MNTFFKDQLVYLKTDRLNRLFTVVSNSTPYGVTWCEDPNTGVAVALDTCNLELAPRTSDLKMERALAAALDEERQAGYALGCWLLFAGAVFVVLVACHFFA